MNAPNVLRAVRASASAAMPSLAASSTKAALTSLGPSASIATTIPSTAIAVDRHWFRFTGIDHEKLKAALAEGSGDGEVIAWVDEHASPKHEPWEIQQWSAYHNERRPDGDLETLEFFAGRVGPLSKERGDVRTWFDYRDLDDHVTFGGKA